MIRRRPARRLDSIEATLEVLRGDLEVVSRTTMAIDGGEVMLEYPVKTVNYSERHRYYQVDTGPVLFLANRRARIWSSISISPTWRISVAIGRSFW